MMEVYANGFAEHQRGYFISCESTSGVMTGWHAIMGIPNGGGFSPNAKGFPIEQCSWFPDEDFLRILRQGARVCAYSARVKVPEDIQNSEGSHAQIKGNHHKTNAKDKSSYLLPKFRHPQYKLVKQPVQHRLELNGISNGIVVAVEALHHRSRATAWSS
jgi:hypothetical protein